MKKLFTIEFKTIHGNRIIKEIKANSADEAHDKLDNKYNIAYFYGYVEGDKEKYINEYCWDKT